MSNLFRDVQDGKVAGPFILTTRTKQVKVIRDGKILAINPTFFAMRRCTKKEKRRQTKGRQVADLTGNGLNGQYSWEESTVTMPSLHFLVCLLNDKEWLFNFDYNAAYRNIPYNFDS